MFQNKSNIFYFAMYFKQLVNVVSQTFPAFVPEISTTSHFTLFNLSSFIWIDSVPTAIWPTFFQFKTFRKHCRTMVHAVLICNYQHSGLSMSLWIFRYKFGVLSVIFVNARVLQTRMFEKIYAVTLLTFSQVSMWQSIWICSVYSEQQRECFVVKGVHGIVAEGLHAQLVLVYQAECCIESGQRTCTCNLVARREITLGVQKSYRYKFFSSHGRNR